MTTSPPPAGHAHAAPPPAGSGRTSPPPAKPRATALRLRLLLPLAVFVVIVAFLWAGLSRDPREVPYWFGAHLVRQTWIQGQRVYTCSIS